MRTYSHFLITAVISQNWPLTPFDKKALLLGSVMPDIPLALLTGGYFVVRSASRVRKSAAPRAISDLQCTDPMWVSSYNFFHAPLLLAPSLWFGYNFGIRNGNRWARSLFWFAVGCSFHSATDMATHYDDGPLALFPLDWETRIKSPVSYWDKHHSGLVFTVLEHILDVMLILRFFWR